MSLPIIKCGWPWILTPWVLGAAAGAALYAADHPVPGAVLALVGLALGLFMVHFHRNPRRTPPPGDQNILSGADGQVRRVEVIPNCSELQADAVRISIFLSPLNVHVNRSPIAGTVRDLGYTPGRHLLTLSDAASEFNEHSSILIANDRIACLVHQIVGPIVRRVVYWLQLGQRVARGDTIGMMRFGSRMDIYLPAGKVDVKVAKGDRVRAGLTIVAVIKEQAS